MYQILIISVVFLIGSVGKLNGQEYFQQQVDYKLKVALDTSTNRLTGKGQIIYYNNAPYELNELYIHTFWNALGDKSSAFAEQRLMMLDTDFHFASISDLGGYEKLDIRIDGARDDDKLYEYVKAVPVDYFKIALPTAISTGETLTLNVEFVVKIPKALSRGGLLNNIYRFTQWYPKVAMYDDEGWHPMTYLDLGEYYYNFGDYDIEISVPKDFVVAHTGIVEGETETEKRKILKLRADNVTDFAWFTSATFQHESRTITLGEREVDLNIYVVDSLDNWSEGLNFLERSMRFYNDEVGAYPFPQVSLVDDGGLSGGGMEYPMITILSNDGKAQHFDHIIAHEIGHNWFYGVLSSNERKYPWLDEGFNSFYDHKYNDLYYSTPVFDDAKPSKLTQHDHELSGPQMLVAGLQATNWDLPISTASEDADVLNYACGNYEEAAWSLGYLESYLGEELFRQCVQRYYKEWQFKHPDPQDVEHVFEEVSGQDLDWFFKSILIDNAKYNHKILGVDQNGNDITVEVYLDENIQMPVRLDVFDARDSLIKYTWIKGSGKQEYCFKSMPQNDVGRISINGELPFLDINRHNNHWFFKGSHRQIPKLNFYYKINDSRYKATNWLPLITANAYDGWMLGAAIYNDILPGKHFRYILQPSIGYETEELVGFFGLEKDFLFQNSGIRKLTLGLNGRSYSYTKGISDFLEYNKLVPSVSLHFDRSLDHNRSIEYRAHILDLEYQSQEGQFVDRFTNRSTVHELKFSDDKLRRLSLIKTLIRLEYEQYSNALRNQEHYLKASIEYDRRITIAKDAFLNMRIFGTYFILNSRREAASYNDGFTRGSFALTAQGYTDYRYDQIYFARNNQSGIWSRQLLLNEGGFKTAQDLSYNIGGSNDWALAFNFKIDIPGVLNKLNITPFIDGAWVSTKEVSASALSTEFYWSGGIAYELSDVIGIYLPLFYSSNLDLGYSGSAFYDRISFRINLDKLNLWKAFDRPVSMMNL
ncbi:MAG: M1 family metallopeptidase [Saprospiraceae bacterium]|nr:M1 family metallopeptidase [Saprospiraceae bacterium]